MRGETVAALAARLGEARAAEVVRERLRERRGAANRDVRRAGRLGDLPETARALNSGSITPNQAGAITDAAEQVDVNEEVLIEAAKGQTPEMFDRTVREHIQERNTAEDPAEQRRRQTHNQPTHEMLNRRP